MKKTVLITGASSGIGESTAKAFLQKGYKVIGTARNLSRLEKLSHLGVDTVALDVTLEASIQKAFQEIFEKHDKIDILVNNAGYSQNGFVEELSLQDMRYQFEVNVFGPVRLVQMVLPKMREARSGRIINVSSVGGDFTTAGISAYHASKYAVESFSDAMRMELKRFGIEVSLIKPGGVKTNFVANSVYPEPIAGNPYGDQRAKFDEMMNSLDDPSKNSFPLLEPEQVADAILKAAESPRPKTRYRVGSTAKILPLMKRLMSDRSFDKMILKQFNMN